MLFHTCNSFHIFQLDSGIFNNAFKDTDKCKLKNI